METEKLYDERELLLRLKSGDHIAFEMMFHRYKSQMAGNALRLLKSPELAEDLLQEIFIRLWEQRSKIDIERTIGSYLYRIASNLAYDYFRKVARDRKLADKLLSVYPSVYEPIEKAVFDQENKLALDNALSMLPEQQRIVFTLCKIEEKSYQEVASMLNISIGTVNNHLTRANSSLRVLLKSAKHPLPFLGIVLLQGIL